MLRVCRPKTNLLGNQWRKYQCMARLPRNFIQSKLRSFEQGGLLSTGLTMAGETRNIGFLSHF